MIRPVTRQTAGARPPDAPRVHSAPRSSSTGVSALFLSVATLLLLGNLALALTMPLAPPRPTAVVAAPPDLAARFYAELNAQLAGAPPTRDDPVLSPHLVVTEPGEADHPLAEWLREVGSDHPLATTLQLTPTSQSAQGDRIVVTVQLRRRATAPDDPLPPVPIPATTLDQLTLADGQVVAYTPGPALATLPWTRPHVPLGSVTQPTMTALIWLALAPGASLADLVTPGPELLLIEQGDLDVAWTGGGQLLRTAAEAWQPLPNAAHALTLAAGDALLLPDTIRHTLRPAEAMPVDLLALAEFPATLLGAMMVAPHVGPAVQSLVDLANLFAVGAPRQAIADVTGTALATAMDGLVDNGCPRALTISQLTLAPGAAIAAHRVDGVELTALASGWPTIGADDGRPQSPPAAAVDLGWSTGSAPQLRNAGVGPLPLVVFSVTPQRGEPCPGAAPPATPAPATTPNGAPI
jgi:hypothetical protein